MNESYFDEVSFAIELVTMWNQYERCSMSGICNSYAKIVLKDCRMIYYFIYLQFFSNHKNAQIIHSSHIKNNAYLLNGRVDREFELVQASFWRRSFGLIAKIV